MFFSPDYFYSAMDWILDRTVPDTVPDVSVMCPSRRDAGFTLNLNKGRTEPIVLILLYNKTTHVKD